MLLVSTILLVLLEGTSSMRLHPPSFLSSSTNNNLHHQPLRTLEQDDGAGDDDYSSYAWLLDYSLKFSSCHTVTEYGLDEEGYGQIWVQRLVKFKLCSAAQCDWNCKGGKYLVKMEDFALAYADRMDAQKEYKCESALDQCGCGGDEGDDDGDEDGDEECEYNCYADASLDYCLDNEDNEDGDVQVDIRDYAECQALDMDEEDEDEQQYYIGLKCSNNGQGINLGIFTDDECMVEKGDGDSGAFKSFPYQDESFVTSDCITCAEPQLNENDEQYYDDDDGSKLSDICVVNYDEAAKCETNMKIDDPDYDACDLIDNIPIGIRHSVAKSTVAAALVAMVFFCSSAFLAVVAMHLVRSAKNREIDLLEGDTMPEIIPEPEKKPSLKQRLLPFKRKSSKK